MIGDRTRPGSEGMLVTHLMSLGVCIPDVRDVIWRVNATDYAIVQ